MQADKFLTWASGNHINDGPHKLTPAQEHMGYRKEDTADGSHELVKEDRTFDFGQTTEVGAAVVKYRTRYA